MIAQLPFNDSLQTKKTFQTWWDWRYLQDSRHPPFPLVAVVQHSYRHTIFSHFCGYTGNHSQEDLARFGYRIGRTVTNVLAATQASLLGWAGLASLVLGASTGPGPSLYILSATSPKWQGQGHSTLTTFKDSFNKKTFWSLLWVHNHHQKIMPANVIKKTTVNDPIRNRGITQFLFSSQFLGASGRHYTLFNNLSEL